MSRAPPSRRSHSRAPSRSDGGDGSPGRRAAAAPPAPASLRRGRRADDFSASPPRRRRHSGRGYAMPREKPISSRVELQLCVFQGAGSHRWRTAPYSFDRRRIEDRELWEDIRQIFRSELQTPWRRFFYFKKVKLIAPIKYTMSDVPITQDEKNSPDKHTYMHAYHHPDQIRTVHEWVDFFTDLKLEDPTKIVGLEFKEGLWAEKLAGLAILITIAIIVVSIVWCVRGGQLQTVFTVMGFVLTGAAGRSSVLPALRMCGLVSILRRLTAFPQYSRNSLSCVILSGHIVLKRSEPHINRPIRKVSRTASG